MNRQVRLNLGCGAVYKPGYINIDRYDSSVADTICDIDNLPFKSNSIALIEASQLIEHFDYVHCKYILSELFRVLGPEGTLILETPDLEKSSKKLLSSDLEAQKTTLQWVYGIDSPGMQHKTGFTFNLLGSLLEETGFEKVSREKPKTHRYEHGIRTICRKPEDCLGKQLFACFRKRLKGKLKTDDSYILIPLESWLKRIPDLHTELKGTKERWIDEIIAKTVICHPYIPLAFLEECIAHGVVAESEMRDRISLLNWLAEMEFHKKVFSLWMKSKKNSSEVAQESENFMARLELLMLDTLSSGAEYQESLGYILDLEPTDDIDIFDFHLVSLEARKLLNMGTRCFDKGELSKASDFFLTSSKMNPGDPLVYWNMARLSCALGLEEYEVVGNYEKVLKLVKGSKNKKSIEAELRHVRENKSNLVRREPITEDSQII